MAARDGANRIPYQSQREPKHPLTRRIGRVEGHRAPRCLLRRGSFRGWISAPAAQQLMIVGNCLILTGGNAARIALQSTSRTGDGQSIVDRRKL
jgi:hypothetical protein